MKYDPYEDATTESSRSTTPDNSYARPLPSEGEALNFIGDLNKGPEAFGIKADYQDILNFRERAKDAIVVAIYYVFHPNSPLARANASDTKKSLIKNIITASNIVDLSYQDTTQDDDETIKLIRQINLISNKMNRDNIHALFIEAENIVKERQISIPNAIENFRNTFDIIKNNPRFFDSNVEELERERDQLKKWNEQWQERDEQWQDSFQSLQQELEALKAEKNELDIKLEKIAKNQERKPLLKKAPSALVNLFNKDSIRTTKEEEKSLGNQEFVLDADPVINLQQSIRTLYDSKIRIKLPSEAANQLAVNSFGVKAKELGYEIVNGNLEKIETSSTSITIEDLKLPSDKFDKKLALLSEEHIRQLLNDRLLERSLIDHNFDAFGKLAKKIKKYSDDYNFPESEKALENVARQFERVIMNISKTKLEMINEDIENYRFFKKEEIKITNLITKFDNLSVKEKKAIFETIDSSSIELDNFSGEQIDLLKRMKPLEDSQKATIGTTNIKLNKDFAKMVDVIYKPIEEQTKLYSDRLYEDIFKTNEIIDKLRFASKGISINLSNIQELNYIKDKAESIDNKLKEDITVTINGEDKSISKLFDKNKFDINSLFKEKEQPSNVREKTIKPQNNKMRLEFSVDDRLSEIQRTNPSDAKDFAGELAVNFTHKLMSLKELLEKEKKECKALSFAINQIPTFFANIVAKNSAEIGGISAEFSHEITVNDREVYHFSTDKNIEDVIKDELKALGIKENEIEFKELLTEEHKARITPKDVGSDQITQRKIISSELIASNKVFKNINSQQK